MRFFLGVDVGSSKTHAVIADETGTCIGFGKAWVGLIVRLAAFGSQAASGR